MSGHPPAPRSDADQRFSLDDLLDVDDDPVAVESPRRAGSRRVRLVRDVTLVAGTTVAVVAGLRAAQVSVSVLLVAAAVSAVRLLHRTLVGVRPPPPPVRRPVPDDGSVPDDELGRRAAGADALRVAVRRWEHLLHRAQTDSDTFWRNVLPVLADLSDERLRQRHGITRASDPRRARQLLGEPLSRLLAESGGPPPPARDWAHHLDTVEKL